MIINILIPTYNRTHFATLQLLNVSIVRTALSEIGIDVQVIISDNHSTPAIELPDEFKSFVQLVKPDKHLNSGEENIIFAMKQCTGEYIWTLGDDDAPILHNVVDLFKQIQQKNPDFIVATSSAYMKDGSVINSQTICSDTNQIKNLPDFVARTGVWHVLTGFSGLIVRRDAVQKNIERFIPYFSASKIYSYAMFLLETFWDGQFMFFPQPIVLAAQNEYGDNWYRMAVMENVFHRFFWTVGFARQINTLKRARKVPAGFFARVLDQGVNLRFPLLCQMCIETLEQALEDESMEKRPSRKMLASEFEEMVDFLCGEEPRMMLFLAPLINKQSKATVAQLGEIKSRLAYLKRDFFDAFYVKTYCGWTIYFFDGVYRASSAFSGNHLSSEFLDIAPITSREHVVTSNLADMERQLALQPKSSPPKAQQATVSILRTLVRKIIPKPTRTAIYKILYS